MDSGALCLGASAFVVVMLGVLLIWRLFASIAEVNARPEKLAPAAALLGLERAPEGGAAGLLDPSLFVCEYGECVNGAFKGEQDGAEAWLVDVAFERGARATKTRRAATVMAFRSSAPRWPELVVQPEPLELAAPPGEACPELRQYLNVPVSESFDERFALATPVPEQAKAAFGDALVAWFLARPEDEELCVESFGTRLLVWRQGDAVPPDGVPAFVALAKEVERALARRAAEIAPTLMVPAVSAAASASPSAKLCPSCGAAVSAPLARYCAGCGHALQAPS